MKHLIIVIIIVTLHYGQSAKILGVSPFPAYSHYKLCDVIFKELARRGHEVTVISPYKEKNTPENFKQILVEELVEKSKKMKSTLLDQVDYNIFYKVPWMNKLGTTFTELALNDSNIKNFLQEKHSFDLVIYQQFGSEAYNGFCYHFKAPCITVSSMVAPGWINRKIANPAPPSYVPQLFVDFVGNMNICQRAYNTFVYILTEFSHYYYYRPAQNKILQTYFPDAPYLDDLYYNISLILLNSHFSINDVAPSLPNLIHIAGAHIDKPKPLLPDLQAYLDNAKDGVIFFSMGSNIKSAQLPANKRNAILNVFAKLKQKVLWKWEEDDLPNKPENVKIGPWFPQQDVLAHPNVVLFITHGGMMSTIEAVHYGVPVFGIPVFTDQLLNMKKSNLAGFGKYVPYEDLNEENLYQGLTKILNDSRFKENVNKRSFILKDQEIKPLDRAVFWVEYVLRHRGAPHLKSPGLSLSWIQYHLIDIISCFIVVLVLIFVIVRILIKKCLSLCCIKEVKPKKIKKQ